MADNLPATPAQAATPGAQEQNGNGSPAPTNLTPNSSGQGGGSNNQEETVSIPKKEYRNLLRQDARAKAFDRKFGGKPPAQAAASGQGGTVDDEVVAAQSERDAAERRALQAEVKLEIKDLLGKKEYENIPQSTKDLILKNPGAISQADTLEDALFDIEEWLNDQASKVTIPMTQANNANGNQPPKHETPPVVNPGGPAPSGADQLEDVTNLRGPAKTQAMLRNAMKQKKAGQA